jgi:LDH2 family malate/lactate/ureidoglycolate dehydrogenase
VVHVSIEEATRTTTRALQQLGWDESDAALQAEIMVSAELCGNNQGLVKMYQPHLMAPSSSLSTTSSPPQRPTLERETASSAVINAHQAPGMIAASMAADVAVQKAHPISIVTTYNTSTSSGQLAFYVERMAKQGVIGMAMANSPEFVAAAPGGKAVFGTNPLAVAVPVAGQVEPFVVCVCIVCVLCYIVCIVCLYNVYRWLDHRVSFTHSFI